MSEYNVVFSNFHGANSTLIFNNRRSIPSKNTTSYKTYIRRVLKAVHPETSLTSKSIAILDDFIKDIFLKIAREASTCLELTKRKTLMIRDIEASIRLVLVGQLVNHAIREGNSAVRNFKTNPQGRHRRYM